MTTPPPGAEFADKVVVVTGGASGIGATTARRFATRGATVVIVDRDQDGAEATAAAIAEMGATATVCAVDLRRDDAPGAVVDHAMARHGRIDVLHNNAGLFPVEGRLAEVDPRRWDLVLAVNLTAAASLCRVVLPPMVAGGGGAIVNTSSAQGRAGDVGWTSYGVAKAGIESLTRYVATQYGRDGVRCNCVAPGLILTPRAVERLPEAQIAAFEANTPLGRLGRPEEVAEVVVFLASSRASFISGQVLAVDGGLLSHMPPAR